MAFTVVQEESMGNEPENKSGRRIFVSDLATPRLERNPFNYS